MIQFSKNSFTFNLPNYLDQDNNIDKDDDDDNDKSNTNDSDDENNSTTTIQCNKDEQLT